MYHNQSSAPGGRANVIIVGFVIALLLWLPPSAGAQHAGHDTTKRAAPATKKPAPTATKPAAAVTKAAPPATKAAPARTKTAPAATKAAPTKAAPARTPPAQRPAAASERSIPIAKDSAAEHAGHAPARDTTAAAKADTTHQHADTARAQPADTAHRHAADSARAQPGDTTHKHGADTARAEPHDTSHARMRDSAMAMPPGMKHGALDTVQMQMGGGMSMEGPLGISMERMGSGTTWIPDAVILPSRHFMKGEWMVMVHGWLFGQYDWQSGPRGANQLGSLNWAMLMADRKVGQGRLQLRFMPSLDPATVGRCGYPLLLQSGETCNGQPLVDRQHPHDFFMELGALYERPVSENLALLLYAAPAGEPALGPVAFMHRPSAMDEPQAPLGHHWQDATHISFGVLTAGVFTRKLRVEASYFNAREPDESRWNFDPIQLNSFSGRVTLNPTANLSFTAGYGKLDNPERETPPESMTRFVSSAMYGRSLGADGAQLATTAILGRNVHAGGAASLSGLVESEAVFDRRNTLFGRVEYVQKSAHDLQLSAFPDERLFNVASASVGYIRELARGRGVTLGLGTRGTLNFVPAPLEGPYGSRTPAGGMVFLRLRPYHDDAHQSMPMAGMDHGGK